MIDDFELLPLQNLCTCPRIRACNILGRCLGGGGGVPLISVSHIAAELFSQLMDTEWRQDSEGAASQGESWRAMVSLCVMHAIVLERCRFAGGWIQGNVVFSDFLAAVTALQRAFKVFEMRGQAVDWNMVRGMVALHYAPLETNEWDSRVLKSLLHKYLHRGIDNARHEVLPGLCIQPPPGRAGMLMSSIVKSLRGNANRDRFESLGLNHTTVECVAQLQDEQVISSIFSSIYTRRFAAVTLHTALVLPAPFVPASEMVPELSKASLESRRRRTGNTNRDAPTGRAQILSLEKQAEVAGLAAQKKYKAPNANVTGKAHDDENAHQRRPTSRQHTLHDDAAGGAASKKGGHLAHPVVDKLSDKDKVLKEDGASQMAGDDGGVLSVREHRILAKIRALHFSLPQPIGQTWYLMENSKAESVDVMCQHLSFEILSLNSILARIHKSLLQMINLLLGYMGSSGSAHMVEILPDVTALDRNSPPPSWQRGCPATWATSSLDVWMEIIQTAHMQLYQWARLSCLRSYYIPVLLHPRSFFVAVKIHMSRRTSTSRLEVVPLEEATIFLSPTNRTHPSQLTPISSNAVIHVHGLVLHGAVLELPRNVLADLQSSQTLTALPLMQVTSLKLSSIQATLEIAFDCPFIVTDSPAPLFAASCSPTAGGVEAASGVVGERHSVEKEMRRGKATAGTGFNQCEHTTLISMILPVESPQDQLRWILRGVHAYVTQTPHRDSLLPEDDT
mmetsp:Transcript_69832/g.102330  ORF Transcript_69832/g.102330 Transcript_69832/m.102330 type:complete len:734 (-) Transcript_69832:15-2216(-)